MAQVPEKTLSWLYSVLHEYQDPQRAYSDIARTLSRYPSLPPATEVYTYENGAHALLVTLTGTLPAAFRGTTYHFPIKIWIPRAFPYEPPMVFVNAGKDMMVRPGQHVAVDGRIYHPYLRDWPTIWDHASIAEMLEYLQQVFSKETPVLSRAQQQQFHNRPMPASQQQVAGASANNPPPPPPKQRVGSAEPDPRSVNAPPPLPPKPGEEYAEPRRNITRDGPPLPPLPHEVQSQRTQSQSQLSYRSAPRTPSQALSADSPGYSNGPPALSPLSREHAQHQQYRGPQGSASPVSPVTSHFELSVGGYSRPAPGQNLQFPSRPYPQQQPIPLHGQQQYQSAYPSQHSQGYHSQQHSQLQFLPQTQQTRPKQATPDLLTDPFEVALPGQSASSPMPAPPIPPNPEKEHLLQAISTSLVQQAQQKVNQNLSAIAPLQAQQQALLAAQQRLDGEMRQLEHLEQALSNNETILRRSIQDCDRTIATAKSKKQPSIDEVLIAPTMVANQLWSLCAEEAACREAMYVLQKAVDRGRISGNDFVRQMRGLGRECFLKKALARKCATGMGLGMNS